MKFVKKRNNWKLQLYIVLTLALFAIVVSASKTYAADVIASGECGAEGDNVTWTLDADGLLTLSGEGATRDCNVAPPGGTIGSPFKDFNTIIKRVEIESGITNIGAYLFAGALTSNYCTVIIPDTVTSIGDNAFTNSTEKAIVVYVPNSVQSVGSNAFLGGNATSTPAGTLYSIVLVCNSEAYVASEESGLSEQCLTYDKLNGKAGRNITYSFDLDSATLTFSGQGEFYSDTFCFAGAEVVKKIIFDDTITASTFLKLPFLFNVEEIVFPESVTSIPERYCWRFQSLKTVRLPQSITEIGAYAFAQCDALETVVLPNNLKTISGYCFDRCRSLQTIEIPDSVESVGALAFNGCSQLREVSFEQFNNEYGTTQSANQCTIYQAFSGCQNIREIEFSENVPNLIFNGGLNSSKIQSLYFPSVTLSIEQNALQSNSELKTVVIKASAVTIKKSAFSYCNALETIRFEGIAGSGYASVDASAFNYVDNVTIYGYAGSSIETFANNNSIPFVQLCDGNEGGTHIYSDWTTTSEATCTEAGLKERTCEACGYTEEAIINALGHNWDDEYTIDQENSCTETGSKSKHCKRCNAINEDSVIIIEPNGHDWFSDYTVDKEATCTEDGEKSIHCKECDETKNITKIDALGHSYADTVIASTCSQSGHTLHVCGRCGDSYTDNETPAKGHSFGEWVTDTDSTCTAEGIQHRECTECGYTETKGINKKEHTFATEFTVDKEPTCTTDGSKSYHCTVDGCTATTGSTVIPATGHQYSEWSVTTAPTCTEAGVSEHECSICGAKETLSVPKLGHEWMSKATVDVEPTCTENGTQSIHCKACDAVKEGSTEEIAATGHSYGSWETTKDPTCTEAGERSRTCEKCGETITEEIAAINHKWSDKATVDTEPTCTETGSKSIHCKVCGSSKEGSEEIIPAKGHSYGSWEITKDPTCTETGLEARECANCGDEETKVIPASGHSWFSTHTIDKEATCTESGTKSIHCKVCDAVKEDSEVTIEPLGHEYTEAVVEPTCSQKGYTLHVCGRCGDSYTDNETQANGHSFGEWVTDTDSTCTAEGIQHRECTECGYIETKGINKKEHSFATEYTVDKEATCTTDGSKSLHCTVEGCTATTGSEVIAASGHQYTEWTETKQPTCEEDGDVERSCTVCGIKETVHFEARGHIWMNNPTVDKYPTCTEEGAESIHCAVCDAVKPGTEQTIDKVAHSWDSGKVTTEPTCTEKGVKTLECTVCHDTKTEEIAAAGHTWNTEYTIDKKATYAAVGSKSIHCSVCDAVKEGSEVTVPKLKVKATSLSTVSAVKNGFTAKWKKGSSITGYELQYALNSKFTKSKKTVKITKAGTLSKKITKLTAKKKYYVRIRTYKMVKGKKYNSTWSKYKTVTTKR